MTSFLDQLGNTARNVAGNAVDAAATYYTSPLKLAGWTPELGVSEAIAGGKTLFSAQPQSPNQNKPSNIPKKAANDSIIEPPDLGNPAANAAAAQAARDKANTVGQLNQSASTLQNGLNRLGGQLDIANSNINSQFGQRDNELNTQRQGNESSYNTSSTQNSQNLRTNKNTITDQASGGLRGLMRMLGSYGATGSDLGLAGTAVSDQASQQNSGAGQTFAQNQSSLDTNWGNYRNQFDNEKKKLNDWKTGELRNAESQSLTTRQDLLSKLADVRGQIGAANGGSYAGSAQAQIDQANQLSGRIDNLGRLNPTYTGNTPQYTAASLDSYQAGSGTAAQAEQGGVAGGLNTPYLDMLLGRDKRQQMLGA